MLVVVVVVADRAEQVPLADQVVEDLVAALLALHLLEPQELRT